MSPSARLHPKGPVRDDHLPLTCRWPSLRIFASPRLQSRGIQICSWRKCAASYHKITRNPWHNECFVDVYFRMHLFWPATYGTSTVLIDKMIASISITKAQSALKPWWKNQLSVPRKIDGLTQHKDVIVALQWLVALAISYLIIAVQDWNLAAPGPAFLEPSVSSRV